MTTALILIVVALVAVCLIAANARGASKPPERPWMPLGDFVMGPEPVVVVKIADTGRKGGETTLTLRCVIHSDDFFARNCGNPHEGHWGVMARASLAGLDTGEFRGVGFIGGSLWTASTPPNGMLPMTSCAAMESWQNGAVPEGFQWVKPQTVSPQLLDGVDHPAEMSSTFTGKRTFRFRVGEFQAPEVVDDNMNISPDSQALVLFAINPGGGVLHITGLTAQWS